MTREWQPGEEYSYGDIVVFDDVEYKLVQPHRSQGDWTPPYTPALWGRMQGSHHRHHDEQRGGDYKHPAEPPSYGHQVQRQQVDQPAPAMEATEEETEKHWYDMDEKRKKELEIGGGLLAGVAAIGAGYYAYKKYEENKEEKQAQTWSLNSWMQESQARTQQWREKRYNAPVAWIWNEGQSIPHGAIQGGVEHGEPLYICRAYHEGGILVGKASKVFKEGAVIGYKKDEIHISAYEILVGNSNAVKWVHCSGRFNLQALNAQPVEGGRESDGAPIYIAQAPYHDAVHPGKACESYGDGCFIPYDDTEKKVKEYAVLCYA